jgi:hypothetical protein
MSLNKPDCMSQKEFEQLLSDCEKGYTCSFGICSECDYSYLHGTQNKIFEQEFNNYESEEF